MRKLQNEHAIYYGKPLLGPTEICCKISKHLQTETFIFC